MSVCPTFSLLWQLTNLLRSVTVFLLLVIDLTVNSTRAWLHYIRGWRIHKTLCNLINSKNFHRIKLQKILLLNLTAPFVEYWVFPILGSTLPNTIVCLVTMLSCNVKSKGVCHISMPCNYLSSRICLNLSFGFFPATFLRNFVH